MTAPKNPRPLGLPLSIPAAQAIENLRLAAEQDAARRTRRGAQTVAVEHLHPTGDLNAALPRPARESRDTGAFRSGSGAGGDARQDVPGPLLLQVTQIDSYDHNPRLFQNERFAEIETSLRETGFHGSLVVTRRRGAERYMLAAGSNTTLRILQRLWRETQDERFQWVNCVFQPYSDELKLLAQHLGENLNRGEMRFWEIACGVGTLLKMIEAQRRALTPVPLTGREQVEELERRGIKADRTSIARWAFAQERLQALQEATGLLTKRVVDGLQPRVSALNQLAQRFGVEEAQFWTQVVDRTLESHAAATLASSNPVLDAQLLADELEAALASHVGEAVQTIRSMLSQLRLSPRLSLAELRMPSPNLVVGRTVAIGMRAAVAAHTAEAEQVRADPPPTARAPADEPRDESVDEPTVPRKDKPQDAPSPGSAQTPSPTQDALLQALHRTVIQLLQVAQLQDCFRALDAMPLGFYIEIPDPACHKAGLVTADDPDAGRRRLRSAVWWTLVLGAGQLREEVLPLVDPDSRYSRFFRRDDGPELLRSVDIAGTPPDAETLMILRLEPGEGGRLLKATQAFESAAARVFEASPKRWTLWLGDAGGRGVGS